MRSALLPIQKSNDVDNASSNVPSSPMRFACSSLNSVTPLLKVTEDQHNDHILWISFLFRPVTLSYFCGLSKILHNEHVMKPSILSILDNPLQKLASTAKPMQYLNRNARFLKSPVIESGQFVMEAIKLEAMFNRLNRGNVTDKLASQPFASFEQLTNRLSQPGIESFFRDNSIFNSPAWSRNSKIEELISFNKHIIGIYEGFRKWPEKYKDALRSLAQLGWY